MSLKRIAFIVAGGMLAAAAAAPASAQFYLNPPKLPAGPVTGSEAGIVLPLPDATPEEQQAGLLWSMRSGLNVAALQCGFEPTLLTLGNYNAILNNHNAELKGAFDTLSKYFKRTNKTAKLGQSAFDTYGTKTYQNFTPVAAQRMFCQVADSVGRDALWAPKGGLAQVAVNRMREFRSSLVFTREPQTVNPWLSPGIATIPSLADRCWDGKGRWRDRCNPKSQG